MNPCFISRLCAFWLGGSAKDREHILSHVVHPPSTRIILSIYFTDEANIYREARVITPILETSEHPGVYEGRGGLRAILFAP